MKGFIRAIFARSATFSHFYILAQLLFVGNGCANRRWVDRVSLLVDNVRFVLTWRLRDGIGGLFPRMNSQEDKAGSCCGLRRMWRYHQPLPPLTPSAGCCVHHVLPLLFKCTSQLGAFCSSHTFPASCIHSWALQPKDKKVHPWCVRSYWSVRLWNSLNERAPNSMAFNLDISRIYGMQELALSLGYSSVRDKDKFQIH